MITTSRWLENGGTGSEDVTRWGVLLLLLISVAGMAAVGKDKIGDQLASRDRHRSDERELGTSVDMKAKFDEQKQHMERKFENANKLALRAPGIRRVV